MQSPGQLQRVGLVALLAFAAPGWADGGSAIRESDILHTIAIQPFVGVGKGDIAAAKAAIQQGFRAKVVVLSHQSLPLSAYYKPRNRYRAENLLDNLSSRSRGRKTIGLVSRDISTTLGTRKDWGILGLARLGGEVGVVSTFRIKPDARRSERLSKIVLHELGHTYGQDHCIAPRCLMNDLKGSIKVLDKAGDFCRSCRSNLRGALK
ncbi:MAG TPA: hypothetical protein VM328_08625 [Fimbriimonadaceae bacterium]|nr:hypothetical protein [Fimbriimonadaceae bacterium]